MADQNVNLASGETRKFTGKGKHALGDVHCKDGAVLHFEEGADVTVNKLTGDGHITVVGQNGANGMAGANGGPGTPGANGGAGQSGMNAIDSTFFIQTISGHFTVLVSGGAGGNGGAGGSGGTGSAPGGNGGYGGNGGNGSNVLITYGTIEPGATITVQTPHAPGGMGGPGGPGGAPAGRAGMPGVTGQPGQAGRVTIRPRGK